MNPTIGRIVHYRMTSSDVALIAQQEPAGPSHLNPPVIGDYYPAMIVRIFGNGEHVNLQVFLDGSRTYWATSRPEGDKPGTWAWPQRAE